MTEAEQKKLNGFLSKTLKMDDEELASLYNEAGELTSLTAAEKADTSRVTKLKEENDSQYKRGQKEVATKLETKLKEKYGVSSDETGVDLVDLILTTELEKVKGKGDEDITAHPEYLKLKSFIVVYNLSDEEISDKNASKDLAKIFKVMKPLNDFLNAPFL